MNKLQSIVKEALVNGIICNGCGLYKDEITYEFTGFSKSGTALLYLEGDNVFCETRYNQIDTIDSFEDFAKVAYYWHDAYTDTTPFNRWDPEWLKVFINFKMIKI